MNFGILVTKIGSSYSSSIFSDEKEYELIYENLISEKDSKQSSGIEFICGIKVPEKCVERVSHYAERLAYKANRGEKIDIKHNLESYCRDVCSTLPIH